MKKAIFSKKSDVIRKIIIIVLLSFAYSINSQNSGGTNCNSVEAFCSDNSGEYIFNNSTNVADAGSLGCLYTTPNPAWFYIKVSSSGDLKFKIIQNSSFDSSGNPNGSSIDVDFISWGPFNIPDGNCGNIATGCSNGNICPSNTENPTYYINDTDGTNIVDCSYDSASIENFTINNAQAGEIYLLLITNYENLPGRIKLEQTNFGQTGAGTTDCSIIAGELGPDQKVCKGTTVTLDGTPTTGTATSYEWQIDTGSGFTVISGETNAILNITNNLSGTYKVIITDSDGNKVEDEVEVTFYDIPIANNQSDIFYCDTDNDGFNSFDLQTLVTPQILGSQDPAIFEVLYYTSQTDADNNTNALPNPYTNSTAFSSQTIYARVHNKNAPSACYKTESFMLTITGYPTPSQPADYEECDDTINGGDTDGFFNNFILSSKDSEILGSLPSTQYSVSYHTSLSGAQTNATTDVIDKNTPYRNITANAQNIYVRVENIENTNCNAVSTPSSNFKPFRLVVNALPIIANNPTEIRQCDTDTDLITNINLTLAQVSISSNNANETFKYYPTENDAINDTSEINTPTSHPVTNGDVVWVRTISNKNCYRISSINIIVGYSADINYNKQFEVCDDFLDINGNNTVGNNSDTDGISYFDISSVINDIKGMFPVSLQPNLDVLIFENSNDRDIVQNNITNLTNYRNINVPASTPQSLYVKIINTTNNDCTGLSQFTIWAKPAPESNTPNNIVLCDDFDSGSFNDGENINIDLTVQNAAILGTQNAANFSVTFYETENDAAMATNEISNPTSYRNNAPTGFSIGNVSEQTIYVRVQNITTSCFNPRTSFKIIVNPLPTIDTPITPLEVCDTGVEDNDTRNGLEQQINLSVKDSEILNGRDPSLFTVSYHTSQQNAIDGINPVDKTNHDNNPANTTMLGNESQETLWIRILNNTTGCSYGVTALLIRIYPEPNILSSDISNLSECDNDEDGDDTNGIIQTIDLTTKIPEILTNYPPDQHDDFKITFHTSQNDAVANTNSIPDAETTKYTNLTPTQTIYIRVENKDTGCVNDDTFFDIIINPLPYFEVTTPQIVCLDRAPDVVAPTLNLEVENANGDYTYQWYEESNPLNILSNTSELSVRKKGNYYIIATNTTTGCKRENLFIQVNESIVATITIDDITIVDDSDNNSITINNDNNNLGIGNYEFALQDEDQNTVRDFQDEPYFDRLVGGIYTIIVRDKNGCQPDQSLDVPVLEFPKFFTPNNDGFNDVWKIKGANTTFFPKSDINIFDRFGKLITKINLNGEGWNGLYNGTILPSNDYWFDITLVNTKGIVRNRKGHFSLLRK